MTGSQASALTHISPRGLIAARLMLFVAILLIAGGCARHGGEERMLTATAPPIAWAVKAVAGPGWEVQTLLPDGADPETYEPTLATMKGLADSRALFTFGSPGFESNLQKTVSANFPDLRTVDAAEGIPRLSGTHDHSHGPHHGHSHDEPASSHSHDGAAESDPHIATTPANMQAVVINVAKAMAEIDPRNADQYNRRADSIAVRMEQLDDTLKVLLSGSEGASFVMMHPSLSYFADRYGLHQIPLGRKGTEESPKEYAARVREAMGARVLIAETSQDPARARELSGSLRIPLLTVSLNSEDWEESLLSIARAIGAQGSARIK